MTTASWIVAAIILVPLIAIGLFVAGATFWYAHSDKEDERR